jgi:microsomal dipeptidase-like Zn-dependent dipeptidase
MKTWFKLKPFWKAANCTTRWKLRVYHEIIQNKLIYGLETLHLTQAMLKKIDAFHVRGLRSIGLETTFVNRRNTSEFVLRTPQETCCFSWTFSCTYSQNK